MTWAFKLLIKGAKEFQLKYNIIRNLQIASKSDPPTNAEDQCFMRKIGKGAFAFPDLEVI
jgi:hypothetical protein